MIGVLLLCAPRVAYAWSDAGVTPPPVDAGYCPEASPTFEPNAMAAAPWEVPANFEGVVVERASGAPTAPEIVVERLDATTGGWGPLAFTVAPIDATRVRVRVTDALAAGEMVRVAAQTCADIPDPSRWECTELVITAAAADPSTLGTLVGPAHTDVNFGGSSWYQIAFYFPSDEALAWRYDYWATLEIDGVLGMEQQPLDTAIGAFAGPRSPVDCPGSHGGGLAPGPHTFRLAGGPWGAPARAYTSPFTVTLDCPPPPSMDGCLDAGTLPDGAPAGGFCPATAIDAGTSVDAGSAGMPDGGATPAGGSCASVSRAPGGANGVLAALAIGALVALVSRRRRVR